jgi:predicted component of type VI protein secretion system
METLKQTLTVPKNHKIHFDITLPKNFPIGTAEVLLVFAPKAPSTTVDNVKKLLKLAGSLENSKTFVGDPVAIQRALRDEWQK